MKIFISHSSKDKELVLMFVDLLVQGFHIDYDEIFCTSMDNALRVGEDFIKSIKENLHDSEIVLFLITQNYIDSKFCIMEMGAAWAFKDNIFPIIVPPLDYNILNDTPLKIIQSIILSDAEDLFKKLYEYKLVEKQIIPRLSFMQEHGLFDKIKQFTENVKIYVGKNYGFNFKDSKIICVAQNGDPDAVKIELNGNFHQMDCNFKANEFYPIPSNFISCVYQFVPHKDWSNITANSVFYCKCRSKNNSIHKVTIEFKCGDNLFKFYEQTFLINDNYSEIKIPISYDTMPQKHLKDISEVCFVIRPNFVKNFIGEIEIGELKFQDNIITNI
ncbi:toll/interleukin-1 receptor domain-containing protein [bacterium D16-51]|nr:toll/interleukin-1 receptor domain-containing protein [bacterium D16-59]RKI58036.1 toll/interleukin-1 receptor domain-containing protein [bacterium D16-51]